MIEVGSKVKGTTTRGNPIAGTVTAITPSAKGKWVKVADASGKEHSTRPSLLELA